jgi:TPP-dependent pyruvate/acetoin dehydrogenase alpha subunit
VDGNDVLAVIAATREAVARARRGDGPTLIEAVTFRMGGHSSSDDPTRYRESGLVEEWQRRDPVARFTAYLNGLGFLEDVDVERWDSEADAAIASAVKEAEALPPPPIESMFTDVYAKMPRHIEEQMRYAAAMGAGGKVEGAFPL